MVWYRTGTVSVTNGSTTVTGTGTDFAANSRVGDAFIGPDGVLREVTNVASATVLSIFPAYSGATAAGAAYTLAPIQGYVKQLADQARQIIQQWGTTLAGLGAVSTESVVPVAKGGTGGTTQALARAGLGLKTAAVADLLGTVSQSGGVPTGAVIERGSNTNGSYVKLADGTMICNMQVSTSSFSASGQLQVSNTVSLTYPATFITASDVTICGNDAVSAGMIVAGFSTSSSTANVLAYFPIGVGQPVRTLRLTAIGRWY